MTVAATAPRVAYAGNGTTVAFAIPFTFEAAGDLVVIATTAGVQTTWTLGANYAVAGGAGAAGTLTATAAPAVGTTLNIIRKTPETQPVDYRRNDSFPAETHEGALDRLQRQVQELWSALGRKIGLTDGETATTTTLLPPADRANKLLGFNASGALDYFTNALGAGSFLQPPTSRTLAADDKVLVQTSAGAGGVTTFYVSLADVQNKALTQVDYTVDTTMTSADIEKVVSNSGATANRTFTLMAATVGRWLVVRNDTNAYTLTLDPAGSEIIHTGGAGKALTMYERGWLTLQCVTAGRWEITEGYGVEDIEL